MEVFVLMNIAKYDELFVRYGEPYWAPSADDPPIEDPVLLTGKKAEEMCHAYYVELMNKCPQVTTYNV